MIKFHGTFLTLVAFLIFLLTLIPLSANAQNYTFFIDEFSVAKNGSTVFIDPFDDGNPPPDAPVGSTTDYSMIGAMGPETVGGKLTLDSTDSVLSTTASGDPVFFQGAILQTSIDPNDITKGLRSDDIFSVTGVFDLIAPNEPRQAYGVRFRDHFPLLGLTGNDMIELSVWRTGTNQLKILFLEANFQDGTIDIIGQTDLDTNHDQITLTLERATINSNAITASYTYIDSGNIGTMTTFGNTVNIFDGENHTRPEFFARAVVPEPISSTLFIVGGATLGFRQWRKKRRTA